MTGEELAGRLEHGPVEVVDGHGVAAGRLGRVYQDPVSEQPVWVSVQVGRSGGWETLVPLDGSSLAQVGLQVPFSWEVIMSAPQVDDGERLWPEEEDALYDHYYGSLLQSPPALIEQNE